MPGNNIAFAFSDPAGANACIAMAKMVAMENHAHPYLFSNRNHGREGLENFHLTNTAPAFNELGIDCVFTGTSHPSSSDFFEVNCIRRSKSEGIHTISFIDHWVNFKLRFEGLEPAELPDEIWVVDEAAKAMAIEEGLPAEKIIVHSNPHLQYLRSFWKPEYKEKKYLDTIGIPSGGFHILFAPDPLSLRDGKKIAGFTEVEALEDLLSVLSSLKAKVHLIVKAHPLQPANILRGVMERFSNVDSYFVESGNTLELLNASDLVIGFYSNILLEAESLGKKVLRYFPGKDEADLLKHNASLPKVRNREALDTKLKNCIDG